MNLFNIQKTHREAVSWLLIAAAVYWLASHHLPVKDKHYVYIADAFLHGSLSVTNPPADLIEVVHYKGGNYFGYGVMPALVLMPFVAIWGRAFDPAIVGILLGAVNVFLVNRIFQRLKISRPMRSWLTALFAFGTVHFHAAIWGTTWFFMQVVAVFFLLLAIQELLGLNRGVLIGVLFGAAVLSRNAILFASPFFLIVMNRPVWSWKRTAAFCAGLLAMLLGNSWYNFARFGSPFENGYAKVFNGEYGLFSRHYLKHNLYTYLLKPPEWLGHFPYLKPGTHGMSLFLTTPAFLLIFSSLHRIKNDPWIFAAWAATAAVGSLYLIYFWDGFVQFGVRYTLDYTPFLMILAAAGCAKALTLPKKGLIVLSILINIWGIIWWRTTHLNLV